MKNNLRVLRATENMTQAELARQSGVSRQTINSVEAGRYIPAAVLALKIAKVFGIPVEQVFVLEQGD
jgi:putative transcriptional regulator